MRRREIAAALGAVLLWIVIPRLGLPASPVGIVLGPAIVGIMLGTLAPTPVRAALVTLATFVIGWALSGDLNIGAAPQWLVMGVISLLVAVLAAARQGRAWS